MRGSKTNPDPLPRVCRLLSSRHIELGLTRRCVWVSLYDMDEHRRTRDARSPTFSRPQVPVMDIGH